MKLEVCLNQSQVNSLAEFVDYESRCNNMKCNSVYVIQNGTDDQASLLHAIDRADAVLMMAKDNRLLGYLRLDKLDCFIPEKIRWQYEKQYQNWLQAKDSEQYDQFEFPFEFNNHLWNRTYKQAFLRIARQYFQISENEQKRKNFIILMFHWIAMCFPVLFRNTRSLSRFPKCIYIGSLQVNEALFFELLSQCGCNVYCINSLNISVIKGGMGFVTAQVLTQAHSFDGELAAMLAQRKKVDQHFTKRAQVPDQRLSVSSAPAQDWLERMDTEASKPMDYEQLAALASGVVMISVFDQQGKEMATGSGVLINDQGYILTNFHVVQGGAAFSVRLEDISAPMWTNELIKYHPENDLALLRIDPVTTKPISLYWGEQLRRGQKVVAIGSPLGLFNTVSDGIIAGFRKLDQRSMIQFTAPISHGSSGGALLNQYGQLIGIVTAGFHDGQNLNLAVDYQTMKQFLNGFIS